MTDHWKGLADTVLRFTESVKQELNKNNDEFHQALNGDEPLAIKGLGPQNEQSEYHVELSDVLFWHDPTAYLDEKQRWEGRLAQDQYKDIRSYLEETEQLNVFSKLVETLKRKRVTPFIGAGFSKPNGYPLWSESIQRLVRKLEGVSASDQKADQPPLEGLEETKTALASGAYIESAQLLYQHQKTQLENFVHNTFDCPEDKILRGPILLLPRLTDGCIITTNFDPLIERVFTKANKPIEGYMHGIQSQNQFAAKLIQGERCILKLHGNYNSPESYIFSQVQYDGAYGNIDGNPDYTKPLSKVLRQIFISHTLLFLGCSLDQDRTLKLFSDVVASNSFDVPDHYAFLAKPENNQEILNKEELLATAKIRPIWYEVKVQEDGTSSHENLDMLLQYATDCIYGKAKV